VKDVPKPMAPIQGKPFLHYIFKELQHQNIENVVLSVGYLKELIQDYFQDNYLGINIQYAIEHEPLGTGGGIKNAFSFVEDDAFVLNGDTYFDIELSRINLAQLEKLSKLGIIKTEIYKHEINSDNNTIYFEYDYSEFVGVDEFISFSPFNIIGNVNYWFISPISGSLDSLTFNKLIHHLYKFYSTVFLPPFFSRIRSNRLSTSKTFVMQSFVIDFF